MRHRALIVLASAALVCGCRSRTAESASNAGFVAEADPVTQDTGKTAAVAASPASDTGGLATAPRTDAQPVHLSQAARAALAMRRTPITDAVARVAPAVVTVQTQAVTHSTDPFDTFFGGGGDRTTQGLGSGFIVRQDGVIVTNA